MTGTDTDSSVTESDIENRVTGLDTANQTGDICREASDGIRKLYPSDSTGYR